jgi:hypothetical protein
MVTKSNAAAITAILTALATSGVAIPASARDNHTPTWDTCFTLAVERGSGPNKGGGDKVLSQYNAFMNQCLAGKIPFNAETNTSAAKLPPGARASTAASGYVPRQVPRYDSTSNINSSYSLGHQSFPNPDRDFSIENLRSHPN